MGRLNSARDAEIFTYRLRYVHVNTNYRKTMHPEEMNEDQFGVRVSCYAGYRGEESPQRFFLGERKIDVLEIIDRWLAPDHRYFKVRGDDQGIYILRHDVPTDRWLLIMFESGMKRDFHPPWTQQREN